MQQLAGRGEHKAVKSLSAIIEQSAELSRTKLPGQNAGEAHKIQFKAFALKDLISKVCYGTLFVESKPAKGL